MSIENYIPLSSEPDFSTAVSAVYLEAIDTAELAVKDMTRLALQMQDAYRFRLPMLKAMDSVLTDFDRAAMFELIRQCDGKVCPGRLSATQVVNGLRMLARMIEERHKQIETKAESEG
jgi:hypothetical protein